MSLSLLVGTTVASFVNVTAILMPSKNLKLCVLNNQIVGKLSALGLVLSPCFAL